MFFRIIVASLSRNPRRKMLAGAALAIGMAVATATLGMALDVGDRMAREFRSLGANLLVMPADDSLPLEVGGVDTRPVGEGALLRESELGKIHTIFWRLNIVGFTPFLEVPAAIRGKGGRVLQARGTLIGTWYDQPVAAPDGETVSAGLRLTHPWWTIEGRWFPGEEEACVVGASLARRSGLKPGDRITVEAGGTSADLEVLGLLTSGGPEDETVVVPLATAQRLARLPDRYRRLLVSALTKPEDDFARRDPAAMSAAEYDRWYCTPYVSSIARQIAEVLPGSVVRPIRRVAEGEGRIIGRVGRLMWTVSLAALLAAALAVGATAATTVMERRSEVGLLKALGATKSTIVLLFLAEQSAVAIAAGISGYAVGLLLAHLLGRGVFGLPPTPRLVLLPAIMVIALAVALLGNLLPLRRAAGFDPAPILRGE